VIDDSIVILKSMSMALRKLEYDVAQAENGLEGLKKLMAGPFDLVLCDFLMPVMDGLDCVKQFRSWEKLNRPGFQQLIVGISAHANENVATQGLAAGMDDFRSKPLRIACVRELCTSEITRSRSMKLDAFVQSMPSSTNLKHKVFSILDRKRGARDDCDGSPSEVPNDQRSKHQRTITGNTTCCSHGHSCLVACERKNSTLVADLSNTLEAQGWKIFASYNSDDLLRLLQTRNWDAVLIDEDMAGVCKCMMQFREWEKHNRVNLQKNTSIMVNLDIPLSNDGNCIPAIHAPSGFDSVVRKTSLETDLKQILNLGATSSLSIVLKG